MTEIKESENSISEEQTQTKRTSAEWVTFGIASSILGAIIGLIIYIGINDKQQPPFIYITQKK
jgi:hypothetical protein